VNDTFPLPQQGQYQQWNPNNSSSQITGGENSTFFPGSGGIPLPGGAPDIPGDTTSDPNTGPGGTNNSGDSGSGTPTMTDQQMIDRLGFDPGDPRNDLTTGFGSGRPTDRTINGIANFLGNAAFPGLGKLTGPAAQGIYDMISHGASREKVQNAITAWQQGGSGDTTGNAPSGGSKFSFNFPNNFGGFGKPMGYFQPTGGYGQGDPGDYNPTGPMGGFGTFGIVDSSSPAGGGSFMGGTMNPNMNLAGSWSNLGASGGGLAPGMANLYLHSAPMQSWAQNQGYKSIGDFMQQTGFSLAGGNPSGANLSGAGRPMTSSR
jgi:hypothetical protein